jgi:hypothetical protein
MEAGSPFATSFQRGEGYYLGNVATNNMRDDDAWSQSGHRFAPVGEWSRMIPVIMARRKSQLINGL